MSNSNGDSNTHNSLDNDSKTTLATEQKDSDYKPKKKNKNKNKKKRNSENIKYSNGANIIKSTKSMIEEIKKESLLVDSISETNDSSYDYSNTNNEDELAHLTQQTVENPYEDEINQYKCIRLLPVFFVFIILLGIYLIYLVYHCLPLIIKKYKKVYTQYNLSRGIAEIVSFHIFLIMYLINYILSIVVSPGYIPNTDEWKFKNNQETYADIPENNLLEKKKTGERRYCKWCCKYKPDRTHHCRVCKKCILKMDHHCPWIYNCVGFNNHKYFILSLIYCCISSIFVSVTMFTSVKSAIKNEQTPFNEMFFLLFGETLNAFLSIIVTCFLFFHLWLMINAMTTIEFCEKQTNYQNQSYSKYYNRGVYGNFKDVFGDSPFLWFLPIDNRKGDGINFVLYHDKTCTEGALDEIIPIKE